MSPQEPCRVPILLFIRSSRYVLASHYLNPEYFPRGWRISNFRVPVIRLLHAPALQSRGNPAMLFFHTLLAIPLQPCPLSFTSISSGYPGPEAKRRGAVVYRFRTCHLRDIYGPIAPIRRVLHSRNSAIIAPDLLSLSPSAFSWVLGV